MQTRSIQPVIDTALVRGLVADQFPQWAMLPVRAVARSGWDNRTFHLGKHMLARMPSAAEYAKQVAMEHHWLPRLAPLLPVAIPEPLAMGKPAHGYPWAWSVYRWLDGETASDESVIDMREFAHSVARFLLALQHVDARGGPSPGPHNFCRGAGLAIYDTQVRQAIVALQRNINSNAATHVWEAGLLSPWHSPPVWVHGDVSAGNLLVREGRLHGVIDFGQMTTGDPACNAAIAWTLFDRKSRVAFQETLAPDAATWARARAWALWKAVIVAAGFVQTNAVEWRKPWHAIGKVLAHQ